MYETVIGIEIHCELKTKTKMFSSAPVSFGDSPNTNVSSIDLGFPGTMPRVNKKAVEYAILASGSLNMEIDKTIVFDRKNYFYPDLPKGFQITQDKRPVGKNGYIEIFDDNNQIKKIKINRLHMEEDTAKQTHFDTYTLIDYNRAGTPLIEIVSEPDIRSAKEAVNYINELRNILLYLGVSDVKMEEGSLRCDINISLRKKGVTKLGTRTEIKNLNSTKNVENAIEYEINRQKAIIESGLLVEQQTLRYDENQKKTIAMRSKGDAVDYKYFTEDNIAPINLDCDYINEIIKKIPILPFERKKHYISNLSLSEYDAEILSNQRDISDFFEGLLNEGIKAKTLSNWITSNVFSYLNKENAKIIDFPISRKSFSTLLKKIDNKEISNSNAKKVFEILLNNDKDVDSIIEENNFKQVSDESFVEQIVLEVLSENKNIITQYKSGKTNILGFATGQVMKKSKGKANPALASKILLKHINKK